ncbi:Gfo/Idh/MocA family oxidoreductase [Luminiphilus sp.]|nr:Gfo/Idh/MocA family oxidoreductase [Luminiphilus sp.]
MSMPKLNFGLLGAAGYIAPRHLSAIAGVGGSLSVALDPSDSVGILDQYFPSAQFFTEFERFDRYVEKIKRAGSGLNYLTICSPNYLHDSHIRFGLRVGADVICEKPLVLNPWNLDALCQMERETGCTVNTILQLRLHPSIVTLKSKLDSEDRGRKHDVDLTYITSRGSWYQRSWKGDEKKSGGIATNIGVHFFDMLGWIYGERKQSYVHLRTPSKAAGFLEYERARVRWYLSLDAADLPDSVSKSGQRTYRSITENGSEIEFSGGFTDLHLRSYEKIIGGEGFSAEDNRVAIETVSEIRTAEVNPSLGEAHPYVSKRS